MGSKKGLSWLDNKAAELKDKNIDFLHVRQGINPQFETLKIIIIYAVLGVFWVLFSNSLISLFVKDKNNLVRVLNYKGWMYVTMTSLTFYIVIKRKMILFKEAVDIIYEGYEEITAANEELIAMEEELMHQYDQIKAHRDALIISEQRYQTLAYYDTITQLPNLLMFKEKLGELIDEFEGTEQKMAIIYLDVDNFKHINDTLGHTAGDKFIAHMGCSLSSCVKPPDIVARLGGDEFAVILLNIENEEGVVAKINCMLKYIRKPWTMQNNKFYTTVSMGVALYPEHGTNIVDIMQNADTAMFEVKEHGKDGFCFFTPHMNEKIVNHVKMSHKLRTAIDNEEFILYYQPQVDLNTNNIIGVEALVRWMNPEKGLIPPLEFIPFAEKTGYIEEIGQWIFKTACKQKREWREAGLSCIKVAINVSGRELVKGNLVNNIRKILEQNCTTCKYIEVEITETAIMTDLEEVIKILNQLKELDVTIALDDFGTGYSSLTYLRRLPIDVLKIDREFVENILNKGEDFYIFKAVMELANNLGLKVIAEGIETKEQLEFLIENGCTIGQGYYFSRPMPAPQIEVFFREGF